MLSVISRTFYNTLLPIRSYQSPVCNANIKNDHTNMLVQLLTLLKFLRLHLMDWSIFNILNLFLISISYKEQKSVN